jgi:peptidyl-prolyl cis-trans isomerase B (cyclophilin B)
MLALGVAACGGDDDGGGSNKPKQSPSAGQPQSATCKKVAQPKPKPNGGAKRPTRALDRSTTYDVVLKTSCGDITIRLDQTTSPKTAASFASLAKSGFFDGTTFHRIVPGFVIQGGDPTGTGTGGPGYSTRDVPPKSATYTKGVVAMAKTGAEPAGLPPDYALLGRVVKGQDVVDAIGELGDPASGEAGTPLQPVVIERASVRES